MQMINWRRGCNNTGSGSRVRSCHSQCFIVVLNTQIIRCVFVWSTVAVERLLNELASLLKMLDHEAVSPATADKMASVRNIVDSMQLSGTTGFIFSLFFLFVFDLVWPAGRILQQRDQMSSRLLRWSTVTLNTEPEQRPNVTSLRQIRWWNCYKLKYKRYKLHQWEWVYFWQLKCGQIFLFFISSSGARPSLWDTLS